MFRWLARKWAVNDKLPEKVDLIAVISYGATPYTLTNASYLVTQRAKEISKLRPEAIIFWGTFSKNQDGIRTEFTDKKGILPPDKNFYVGQVSSTTDECEAIFYTASQYRRPLHTIVVVAEASHSRRAKKVWRYYFPTANICFQSINAVEAQDPENPMFFQRNWKVWLLVNILLYPLYLGKNGVKRMSKINFRQPT